jgi:hypothetical protein
MGNYFGRYFGRLCLELLSFLERIAGRYINAPVKPVFLAAGIILSFWYMFQGIKDWGHCTIPILLSVYPILAMEHLQHLQFIRSIMIMVPYTAIISCRGAFYGQVTGMLCGIPFV